MRVGVASPRLSNGQGNHLKRDVPRPPGLVRSSEAVAVMEEFFRIKKNGFFLKNMKLGQIKVCRFVFGNFFVKKIRWTYLYI